MDLAGGLFEDTCRSAWPGQCCTPLSIGFCAEQGSGAHEGTGYIAKRHEFEPEYDPDAERIIAELEFADDDALVRALSLRAPCHGSPGAML